IGDQDHSCVAMPVAAMLACAIHQPLDLAFGEVSPLDCQVYDAWGAFLGCRFHADKLCLRASYCIDYTSFLHSRKGTQASPADVCEPPGGEGARKSKIHPGAIPGNLVRNDFWR